MNMENRNFWDAMSTDEYRKAYCAFMYNPDNVGNCAGCPSNYGYNGHECNGHPCGQQNCWVRVHLANAADAEPDDDFDTAESDDSVDDDFDMCDPNNIENCDHCPENWGHNGHECNGHPCGQQNCWVSIYLASEDDFDDEAYNYEDNEIYDYSDDEIVDPVEDPNDYNND